MSRAFLYMVVRRCRSPVPQSVFMVHRINPSRLFFSNKDDQRLPTAESAKVKGRLPRPALSLYPSFESIDYPPVMDFALFGRNKDKIVAMDYHGRNVLYDDALRAVSTLPSTKDFMDYQFWCPLTVLLPIGGDGELFVMNNLPFYHASSTSVALLINQGYQSRGPCMFWKSIPPPPYVKPEYDVLDSVKAYTVVGESQVWVSVNSCGTYSLDLIQFWYNDQGNEIRRGEWSKVGDWVLPFHGPAVYAPELNLWFGFSKRDDSNEGILRAVDLQKGATKPPTVIHEWDCFTVPKTHYQTDSFLVHLGTSGRFCIAEFSNNKTKNKRAPLRKTVMLTGVEVTPSGDGEALRLVKHKTYRYGLGDDNPICVL